MSIGPTSIGPTSIDSIIESWNRQSFPDLQLIFLMINFQILVLFSKSKCRLIFDISYPDAKIGTLYLFPFFQKWGHEGCIFSFCLSRIVPDCPDQVQDCPELSGTSINRKYPPRVPILQKRKYKNVPSFIGV